MVKPVYWDFVFFVHTPTFIFILNALTFQSMCYILLLWKNDRAEHTVLVSKHMKYDKHFENEWPEINLLDPGMKFWNVGCLHVTLPSIPTYFQPIQITNLTNPVNINPKSYDFMLFKFEEASMIDRPMWRQNSTSSPWVDVSSIRFSWTLNHLQCQNLVQTAYRWVRALPNLVAPISEQLASDLWSPSIANGMFLNWLQQIAMCSSVGYISFNTSINIFSKFAFWENL